MGITCADSRSYCELFTNSPYGLHPVSCCRWLAGYLGRGSSSSHTHLVLVHISGRRSKLINRVLLRAATVVRLFVSSRVKQNYATARHKQPPNPHVMINIVDTIMRHSIDLWQYSGIPPLSAFSQGTWSTCQCGQEGFGGWISVSEVL